MEKHDLTKFVKGWVCGDFEPSLFKTSAFEIAVKRYKAGDYETRHYHKLASEYTIIVSGRVLMNEIEYTENDIVVLQPYEDTNFYCLTDVVTVVIKTPSVNNDKYLTTSEK